MDPTIATVVLSSVKAAANSASQEAGKQAWKGLVALVRRARRQPDAVVELAQVELVASTLVEAADLDSEFAADLRDWIELVAHLAGRDDSVSNAIHDNARTGNVVQARDISGPVTFR